VPRVVLDTNILVSAFITPRGTPAKLLRAWRDGQFDLVTSPPLFVELQEVLHRPKIRARYHLTQEDIHNFLTLLASATVCVPGITTVSAPIQDHDDLMVLATAIESQAAYLVTGDNELLQLERFRSVHIITPSLLLRVLISHKLKA
jgi:putative PIN family toxin of toxin-antitoxin system